MVSKTNIFLAHYGVLGMKWGVRKDNYSSGYIPKNKKPDYRINKDGRLEIDKGFRLRRIFHEKYSDGSEGSNYFSFTKEDNYRYTAMMGAGIDSRFKFIKNLASNKTSTFVAKEKLRSPNRKEAFEILQETLKQANDKGQKPFKGNFGDRGSEEWYELTLGKSVRKFSNETKSLYKSNLRKNGYNILIDETDSGFLSELPIIVLDGKRSLSLIEVSDVSREEVRKAKDFIKTVDTNKSLRTIDDFIKDSGKR